MDLRHVSPPAGADILASYQNGKLTLHFHPEKEIPGGGKASFLFVENSATFIASIPLIFKHLAYNEGQNIPVEFCTFGGATLMEYADKNHDYGKTFRDLLNQNDYDFIVLQDAGRLPSADTHKALETLISLIRKNAPSPLIYMRYSDMVNHGDFFERPIGHCNCYAAAGKKYGIPVAPAAVAYYNCVSEHPEINLYSGDLDHHSLLGAYLNACVFLRAFLNLNPVGNLFLAGINPETAKILQRIAEHTCHEPYRIPLKRVAPLVFS